MKRIICLDFDGVINSYSSGWQGVDVVNDPPVPGVFEWILKALKYFEIHVYSSRSSSPLGRVAMYEYIKKHSPYDIADELEYTEEKPRAFVTIDDRCIPFVGDWSDPKFNPATLMEFKSWYQLRKK